jgi:uncharacterized membrane protein
MNTEKIVYLLIIIGGIYLIAAEATGQNPIISRAAAALIPS